MGRWLAGKRQGGESHKGAKVLEASKERCSEEEPEENVAVPVGAEDLAEKTCLFVQGKAEVLSEATETHIPERAAGNLGIPAKEEEEWRLPAKME